MDTGRLPVRVVFVRPLRVGSTTLHNMLERYAKKHGLRILGGSAQDLRDMEGVLEPPYDISAKHIAYSRDWFDRMIPNATYFTFVRDPLRRAISSYHEFFARSQEPGVGFDQWYEDLREVPFVDSPAPEDTCDPRAMLEWTIGRRRIDGHYVHWFGCEGHNIDRELLVSRFHFVGVTERFEESLAVLRRVLGWQVPDVLYSDVVGHGGNCGAHPIYLADSREVSETVRDMFYERNAADLALYSLANQLLDEAIAKLGESVLDEANRIEQEYLRTVPECLATRRLARNSHREPCA